MRKTRLLQAYPALGKGLCGNARARATEELIVTERRVEAGVWAPSLDVQPEELGLLVLDGLMIREVVLAPGRSMELIGRGDVLRPWQEEPSSFGKAQWEILEPTRLAILDAAFSARLCRWPTVVSALLEASVARCRIAAVQAAITTPIGIDQRLYTLLWLLAERWGRLGPNGVRLAIRLPHRVLGALIGVRRPTASSALGRLERKGLISRAQDGCWELHGNPPALPGESRNGDGDARRVQDALDRDFAPG